MTEVRPAAVADSEAMARVHVAAWQAGYRGLIPDDYLDALDPVTRAALWRERLTEPVPDRTHLVVEDADGEVVGISTVGPARDTGEPRVGELWMLNLTPSAWGTGLGRRLLAAATEELRRLGFTEAVLWVLRGNERACRFYARAGWRADGAEKVDRTPGFPLVELRYRRPL